jgi:hypothetical protein
MLPHLVLHYSGFDTKICTIVVYRTSIFYPPVHLQLALLPKAVGRVAKLGGRGRGLHQDAKSCIFNEI